MAVAACLWGTGVHAAQPVGLRVESAAVELATGAQVWRFTRVEGKWGLESIDVEGKAVATPISRADGFFVGGGEASEFVALTNSETVKAAQFTVKNGRMVYTVDSREPLPLVHVRLEGVAAAVCAFRSATSDAHEHGAWVTRGYVATDADAHEDFIDASGPMVFGHSQAAGLDAAYLFLPKVADHLQRNGRTEQRSDTWFSSSRLDNGDGRMAGCWQLRMSRNEPKEFAALFDRDLGGRFSDVCEKYFAPAVDTLVDIRSIPQHYDPRRCMEVMPVRLASPDAFIPGHGWMMDEYPKASYPFAHDCVWQEPALLAFEGLATRRDWERNFATYFLDRTPLEGKDGTAYFVRRPGGLTRWAYWSTYKAPFPYFEGGNWWTSDLLYRTAQALGDAKLRRAATDMALHDIDVKLNLATMMFPPCWNAIENRVGDDRRDDWYKTPGLAYCAWAAARIAYPETHDPGYLKKADRICDWFADWIGPERKMNHLQGNNMHAVFSHYLTLMFIDRYERCGEKQFLDMARDMAWVHIMTVCTTGAKDPQGHPLTGTTCVGVRESVDYDCAPNLCHEKDLTFVHIIGPLLDHTGGPAYAKYLALIRLVLDKDSWKSAWAADISDTNLRTMYDTYARGMANLIFALDTSTNPGVVPLEMLVSKSDTNITNRRSLVLANGTADECQTRFQTPYLLPGTYEVRADGTMLGTRSSAELAKGMTLSVPGNSMKRVEVRAVSLEAARSPALPRYEAATNYLSDLEPYAAQRGIGRPQPIYQKDRSFGGKAIRLVSGNFDKGLGCAANTVLVYQLDGRYERFQAQVGVDQEKSGVPNPSPSVFFTAHVDGKTAFESGPMFTGTPARAVDIDVRGAQVLMLRMSCNWDDNGDNRNDYGDWADARLMGRAAE